MITCLTSLFHYASQSYYDELVILSKVFCWNKVCQVGARLFSNGHTQLVGIHPLHTEHQGRRLSIAIIITLLTFHTSFVANIGISRTVYHGFRQDHVPSRPTLYASPIQF